MPIGRSGPWQRRAKDVDKTKKVDEKKTGTQTDAKETKESGKGKRETKKIEPAESVGLDKESEKDEPESTKD